MFDVDITTLGRNQALRYDVEAGSPLYAEVFRRLVRNEGLKAVLDLAPRKPVPGGEIHVPSGGDE